MPTSGEADCEIASEASGTPPNGNDDSIYRKEIALLYSLVEV
jgi:hypothetical protein